MLSNSIKTFLRSIYTLGTKATLCKILPVIVVSSSMLLFSACGFSPSEPEPQNPPDTATLFQQALDRLQATHQFPGATAAYILPDGSTAVFATGLADKEQNIPMRPESRMLAGSIGKSFVAAVALNLVQEGKLDLDDKIEKWLGEEPWFPRLQGGDEITLRMLLNHRTGINEDIDDPARAEELLRQLHDPDWNPNELSIPWLLNYILDGELQFPPGQGFLYSDVNYLLVGLIIEKVAQSTYYQEVISRFLNPLNLRRTEPSNKRVIEDLATGYLLPNNFLGLPTRTLENGALVYHPGFEWTGGGLVSNAEDLVRWIKTLCEGNAMSQPYLDDLLNGMPRGNGGKYGMGMYINEEESGMIYYHGGFMPGYLSLMMYYPDHKIAVAIQINRDYDVDFFDYSLQLTKIVINGLN